jgi:hypothetical protein
MNETNTYPYTYPYSNDPPQASTNPFSQRTTQEEVKKTIPMEPIPIGEAGMELTNFEQAKRVAVLLFATKLIPAAFRTPEQVLVALLRALELKLPPLQAIEGMTIINNKVGLMGDLALSMVEASGLLEKKRVKYTGEGDSLMCTVTLQRRGREAQSYSFSVEEARAAGIFERSAPWRSYPKRMTYYRALGFGLRDEFSDILKGIKTVEELQDYPDAPQSPDIRPIEKKKAEPESNPFEAIER